MKTLRHCLRLPELWLFGCGAVMVGAAMLLPG